MNPLSKPILITRVDQFWDKSRFNENGNQSTVAHYDRLLNPSGQQAYLWIIQPSIMRIIYSRMWLNVLPLDAVTGGWAGLPFKKRLRRCGHGQVEDVTFFVWLPLIYEHTKEMAETNQQFQFPVHKIEYPPIFRQFCRSQGTNSCWQLWISEPDIHTKSISTYRFCYS